MEETQPTNQDRKLEVASIMFVPRSHEGKLLEALRKAEATISTQSGYRVKLVERSGDKLVDLLVKPDPLSLGYCGRETCKPCQTQGEKKQICWNRSCNYVAKSRRRPEEDRKDAKV